MQSHPKRTTSPLLPPEVWICIFHHATDPGILISDIYAHATLIGSDLYNERYHADLRKALRTKRALVCVCKQWWHLAIPFLYQSVYIGRACYLSSLSRTLVDSAADKGTMASTRPLGEYTQRLDVDIRDFIVNADAESGFLITIIKHLPHLAIAVFAIGLRYVGRSDIAEGMIDALQYSAPSLRVLDGYITGVEPSNSRVIDLFAKCTQLRILHYPHSSLSKSIGIEYDYIPATVSTLRLNRSLSGQTRNLLEHSGLDIAHRSRHSALRELIVDLHSDHSHWEDTFRVFGPQLDSVHFYIAEVPSFNIGPHMKLLAETCPGLRRLTITSNLRFEPFDPNFVLPSVTYLGLNNQDSVRLLVAPEQLTSTMHSLRVVQLLNETHLNFWLHTYATSVFRALQPYVEAASFRIEDWDGVLLTDRLRALGHPPEPRGQEKAHLS